MRHTKRSILQVALALSALGLGAGCELAVPLVVAGTTGGGPEEPPSEFVPSSMTMELAEADGYVLGDDVADLDLSVPFDLDLFRGFLFVQIDGSTSATTSLQVETCDLAFGQGDPYGGLDQPLPSEGFEDPLATTACGAPTDLVGACPDFGDCAHPVSAQVERVATAEGTEIRVHATWDDGRPLFLRFREVR